MTYRFGPFVFDGLHLTRNGKKIHLFPQERELLEILLNRNLAKLDGSQSKEEITNILVRKLWKGDLAIEELSLTDSIPDYYRKRIVELTRRLRSKLGGPRDRRYITTSPYRLDCKVELAPDTDLTRSHSVSGEVVEPSKDGGADPRDSPYLVGPFTAERAADFFGRRKEVDDLADLLRDPEKRVILLYSRSGAGKTSLINTALRTKLVAQNYEVLPIARVEIIPSDPSEPGQNPYTHAAIASMRPTGALTGSRSEINWTTYLSAKESDIHSATVLVIDQLEEIVTTRRRSPEDKNKFFVELRQALLQHPSLRLILAFRQEYLAELQELGKELSPFWTHYALSLLSREDAKIAISGPARNKEVEFDSGVLAELVNALATVHDVDDDGQRWTYPGRFVEPFELQLLCKAFWETLTHGQTIISQEDLRRAANSNQKQTKTSQVSGTVGSFVESVLQDFCAKSIEEATEDAQTQTGKEFPTPLTDLGCLEFISDRGRRLVREDDGWTGNLPNEIVRELANQQFLRIERRLADRWFELAHDTLIKPVADRGAQVDLDSLYSLFSTQLHEVLEDEEGIDEAAIAREFCLLFISEDGAETEIPPFASDEALKNAEGRLPLWIVEALEQGGILRRISRPEMSGYRLVHPKLALAIRRGQRLGIDDHYRAARLLETRLKDQRSGASPEMWYRLTDQTIGDLQAIKTTIGLTNLSKAEAGFVLRQSLAAAYSLREFTTDIAQRHSELVGQILKEACESIRKPHERRSAAIAFGSSEFQGREELLVALALNDPDESVQLAAANTLAQFSGSKAWSLVFASLERKPKRARALTVLAWMHDAAPQTNMQEFQAKRKELSKWLRVRLRSRLTTVRLRRTWKKILVVGFIGLLSTLLVTVPVSALLALFDLTTTQKESGNVLEGVLNGALGVIPWVILIGGSLLVWWMLFEGRRPWRGRFSPVIGTIAGLIGGVVNAADVVFAYGKENLKIMRWVPDAMTGSLIDGLIQTRALFLMPLYGAFVGLGVGLAAHRMLRWWKDFVTRPKDEDGSPETERALREIVRHTLIPSLLILGAMLAVAAAFYGLLSEMQSPAFGREKLFNKLFGEAIREFSGGLGLVMGLFLGLQVLRRGIDIPGEDE